MAKKKTYTLDTQEQELGAVIDQSIRVGKNQPSILQPQVTTPQTPNPQPQSSSAPVVSGSPADSSSSASHFSEMPPSPPKKIMKNIWVPPTLDSKVKVIRAYRKSQGMEATFDAVANEAIREYVENHLKEAMEWGMA